MSCLGHAWVMPGSILYYFLVFLRFSCLFWVCCVCGRLRVPPMVHVPRCAKWHLMMYDDVWWCMHLYAHWLRATLLMLKIQNRQLFFGTFGTKLQNLHFGSFHYCSFQWFFFSILQWVAILGTIDCHNIFWQQSRKSSVWCFLKWFGVNLYQEKMYYIYIYSWNLASTPLLGYFVGN